MPVIKVILEGDGALADMVGREADVIFLTAPFTVAALAAGMQSGAPSLAIRIDLPDGRVVFQETSLGAWIMATAALRGRFPEAFRRAGM